MKRLYVTQNTIQIPTLCRQTQAAKGATCDSEHPTNPDTSAIRHRLLKGLHVAENTLLTLTQVPSDTGY